MKRACTIMKAKVSLLFILSDKIKFMKLVKLSIFILFLPLFLVSCLDGDNKTTSRAVVFVDTDFSMGGTIIDLGDWENAGPVKYAAPSMSSTHSGKCLYVEYTIDYDNQPSSQYYTATDIAVLLEFHKNEDFKLRNGEMPVTEFTDSIYYVNPASFIGGILALEIVNKAPKDEKFMYELVCNIDSVDAKGIPTMYLNALKTKDMTGTATDIYSHAYFDITDFYYYNAKDTVFNGANFRIANYNLKYQFGHDSEGNPVYKNYEYNPLRVLEWVK